MKLTNELIQLMADENMVRIMRHRHPNDQEVQLEMDRRQTRIDSHRAGIEELMESISSEN